MKKIYLTLITSLFAINANAQSFPTQQNPDRQPVQVQSTAQSIDDIIALSIKTQDEKNAKSTKATTSTSNVVAKTISADNAELINRIEKIEKNINNFAPTMSKNMQDLTTIRNNADSLIKDVGIQLQDLKNAIQMNELRYSELLNRIEMLESKSGITNNNQNQMKAIPLQESNNTNNASQINFNNTSPIEQELQKIQTGASNGNNANPNVTMHQNQSTNNNTNPQNLIEQNQQAQQRRFTQFDEPQQMPQANEYIPLSRNQIIIPNDN